MIEYLSTLGFSQTWLDELASAAPDVRIRQITAEEADGIPADVWAQVEVLHTSGLVPDRARVPRLRWVQLDTAGIDHLVGHPLWGWPDVSVTTLAGVSPTPMAEYVMMMVLAHAHHLPALLEAQRERDWPSPADRWRRFMPEPIAGTTMVIVGMGRIGRRIAELASAVGIEVIGVTRSGRGPDGDSIPVVGVQSLRETAARADQLVVVTPLTAETRGLIDAEVLGAVRAGCLLVDVGRGGVVDEDALLSALDSGRLGGAVLDVFAAEPLPRDHALWSHPRVIITPHVSGFAPGYAREVAELLVDNLARLREGRPLRNLVDGARGY